MGPALGLTQPPSWGTAPVHLETAQIWLSCGEGPCPLSQPRVSLGLSLCDIHTVSSHSLACIFTYFLDLSLFLFGGCLSQRVRNLPFIPTTWCFGVCVLLVYLSMLVVFILNPCLVYTCVRAILSQLWACLTLVQ